MTIAIAPLARDDVEALCTLAREIWRSHYPPIIGAAQTEYMLAQRYDPATVSAELARQDIRWVVAYEDETPVGFASYHLDAPGEVRIDKLYVHPARQRRGIGGMLVEHACKLARTLGASAVTLAVNKRNRNAIAAYHKHGFEIREAVVKEIGGGFVMDDYVMARKCAP
jgi:ribosomal protein S18 acetylase RimI-like enzyme